MTTHELIGANVALCGASGAYFPTCHYCRNKRDSLLRQASLSQAPQPQGWGALV